MARKKNRQPADLFLMLLAISFALHSLASFLLYELSNNPYFRKGFMNFTLLTYGPLTLMYAQKSKNKLQNISSQWWLLAPAMIWSIPYFIILGLWLADSFFAFAYLQLYNRSLLIVMGPLNIICFLKAMHISRSFPATQSAAKNLIRIISITAMVSIIFCLFLSFYIIAEDIPFGVLHQVVRTVGVLGVIIASLAIARYALISGDRQGELVLHSPKGFRPVQLNKERLKEIYDLLTEKVQQDRLFLDPDLNMEKLTAATGYSRHQISEVLNQYADISFYSFINRFRVEQVCEQMKKAATKSTISSFNMLDLSYACGFKSKSTFNEYFRRFTNQTPSQYWNNLHMKEKKV